MASLEQQIDSLINQEESYSLIAPAALKKLLNVDADTSQFVARSRKTIANIINNNDKRILIVVGPCSIHDPLAALEYAKRLKKLSDRVSQHVFIAMRVYFAKPRTSIGWQGFITDPNLDNGHQINQGLYQARELLVNINQLGIPVATEFLDTITPQYILDLTSWVAIGARSVENQQLRNYVSGLDLPVGFKNATSGKIDSALDALITASMRNLSLTINDEGKATVKHTQGNLKTHIILRGGHITGPNYSAADINQTLLGLEKLKKYNLNKSIMIDCSHGNSEGSYEKQIEVFEQLITQLQQPHGQYIKGIMLESFLHAGRQNLSSNLEYGVSITDPCLGWEQTVKLICDLNKHLSK